MKKLLITLPILFSTFAVLAPATPALALFDSAKQEACAGAKAESTGTCDADATGINNLLKTVIQIFSVVVGIVAVIMIVLSGFRFITSQGDPGNIAKARAALIYALVGLIVVALSQAVIKFVLVTATQPPPGSTPQCSNGLDDDHGGGIDYNGSPADPDCTDANDNSE